MVVNVGTIGRPANDGRREGWSAIVERGGRAAAGARAGLLRPAHAAPALRTAGLPEPFAETAETGWWTSCLEVVPPAERARGRYQLYREVTVMPRAAGTSPRSASPSATVAGPDHRDPPRTWPAEHCALAVRACRHASARSGSSASGPWSTRRSTRASRRSTSPAASRSWSPRSSTCSNTPRRGCRPSASPTRCCSAAGAASAKKRGSRTASGSCCSPSIDGAEAATHDRWRGEGSFARAMGGDRACPRAGDPAARGDDRDARERGRGRGAARPARQRGGERRRLRGAPARAARLRRAPRGRRRRLRRGDGARAHGHPRTACTGTRSAATSSPRRTCSSPAAPASLAAEGKRRITERFLGSCGSRTARSPQPYHCAV